ncbi:MAG TPA: response regulator [Pseudomonadota bacterium]|nr:response regulator [Pseudomonadota bacterium]
MLDELRAEFLAEFVSVARSRIKTALALLYASGPSGPSGRPPGEGEQSVDELMHTIAGEAAMIGLPDVATAARAAQAAAKICQTSEGRNPPALIACARAIRGVAVLVDALKPAVKAGLDAAAPSRDADGQGRVLIVDDSPFNGAVLGNALVAAGMRAVAVPDDLERALAELETLRPQIVLVDAIMPNLDPAELCRRIRALPGGAAIKLLLFTAMSHDEAMAQAGGLPVDGFITKDVGIPALVARLRALLPEGQP